MESGGVAFWITVLATPLLIRWFVSRKIGQHIREDGPATHMAKAGTPTMGGIVIVAGVAIGFFMGHVGTMAPVTRAGILVVGIVVVYGVIGFLDDWIKVRHRRSLGLNKRAKFAAQLLAGVAFALLSLEWAGTSTTLSFTRYNFPGLALGSIGWVVFATLVVVGSSNAVNLTDGLDGLAAGSSTFCFSVLAIIGYWQFRHFDIYHVRSALDFA